MYTSMSFIRRIVEVLGAWILFLSLSLFASLLWFSLLCGIFVNNRPFLVSMFEMEWKQATASHTQRCILVCAQSSGTLGTTTLGNKWNKRYRVKSLLWNCTSPNVAPIFPMPRAKNCGLSKRGGIDACIGEKNDRPIALFITVLHRGWESHPGQMAPIT